MAKKYAIICGEFSWEQINSLDDASWHAHPSDALSEACAEIAGEPFICADGEIELTPCTFIAADPDGYSDGYLVQFIGRGSA